MGGPVHPTIKDVFCLLDRWRHFAYYQLEPRVDVLFALFLPRVLEKCFGFPVDPRVIPQFPLKKSNNQADRVDYFALSENGHCGFLIELKTDMGSWRDKQCKYLMKAKENGTTKILCDLKEISKVPGHKGRRKKYLHMLNALSELGLDEIDAPKNPELKVVYVQPRQLDERQRTDCSQHVDRFIYFKEFAGYVEGQGQIGKLFADYLRKWTRDAAESPPSESK